MSAAVSAAATPGRRSASRDGGFTLLEVLAALVVLGFLVAGLSGGVRLGMRAWDQQEREVAGHGDLDAADRALRRLVAGIDPGTITRTALVTGDAGRLAMTTMLPAAASAQPAEVALGLGGDGRLVMRWTPREPGPRLGPPSPPQEAELLRGVGRVQFAYWPRPGSAGGAGWRDGWDRQDTPGLIRIRLFFADGRHWPDIIAAPMRERPGGR